MQEALAGTNVPLQAPVDAAGILQGGYNHADHRDLWAILAQQASAGACMEAFETSGPSDLKRLFGKRCVIGREGGQRRARHSGRPVRGIFGLR